MTTMELTIAEQVQICLHYLASRCDGAKEQDGEGFNRLDAAFGQRLAAESALSPAQIAVAAKMLRKYRRQLERGGINLPEQSEVEQYVSSLPVPLKEQREVAPRNKENKIFIDNERLVVAFDYDPDKVAAMQPLKKSIAGWDFNKRYDHAWSFPIGTIDTILDALSPFLDEFTIAPEIEAQHALQREQRELEAARHEEEIKAALARVQPYLDGAELPCGQALFAHQREAVKQLIEGKRMILAHDMGLGKTRTALVAALAYEMPVIVVCPASLKINWLREAEAVGIAIEVWSWAKMPAPPECNYVLIADEAHYAQSGSRTIRGQAFLDLAAEARAVFCLTGTPLKNGRPINLFPLLQACQHPLAEDKRAYELRYCAAHLKPIPGSKKSAWDTTGAAHLDELYRKTSGSTILYKKKKECLDLPAKIRVFREVEVSKEARHDYLEKIEQWRKESLARIEATKNAQKALLRAAIEAGEDISEVEVKDPEAARALVELGILRHAGSLAKVESAIEIAQEILEQGESIVIFTAYLDTCKQIAEALGAETITGGQTTEERQAAIDRFQARESRAIVCMFGAGGVGITLTAAQTVLLVDRPWTPGDAMQAEDRCHRIGQTGSVTAIWLQYEAIDAKIDALLQAKQERIELVLSGRRKTMRGIKSVASMAKEILASIKSGAPLEDIEEDEEMTAETIVQPAKAEEVAALPKPKHPGGRPRKEDRVRVDIKLTKKLQTLTENIDRSQLIIDLLNKHFGINPFDES
jgi:superfamily II DNA or RNA helicase